MDLQAARQMISSQEQIERLLRNETPYSGIAVRVYNSAAISVPNNTITALTFNSERFDDTGMHSTVSNTGRLTCNVAGWYLIIGSLDFANAAGGRRLATIRLNGTTDIGAHEIGSVADATAFPALTPATLYQLAVGDYVELTALQVSGGNLNVRADANRSPEFMMIRIA